MQQMISCMGKLSRALTVFVPPVSIVTSPNLDTCKASRQQITLNKQMMCMIIMQSLWKARFWRFVQHHVREVCTFRISCFLNLMTTSPGSSPSWQVCKHTDGPLEQAEGPHRAFRMTEQSDHGQQSRGEQPALTQLTLHPDLSH